MTELLHLDGRIEARLAGELQGSVTYQDHGDWVSATNLELAEGVSSGVGVRLAYEVAKIAGNKDIYCRVDFTNERAIKFYIKAGLVIQDLVMVRSRK